MIKRTITKTDRLVAGNIKRLRELQGFSRRELEEKSGIAYGILDQIETLHKPAGKSIQRRIMDALRCPPGELYKNEEPKVMEPAMPYLTKRQKRLLEAAERLADEQLKEVLDYMEWMITRKKVSQKKKRS